MVLLCKISFALLSLPACASHAKVQVWHVAVAEGGPLLVKDSHSTRVTLVSYGLSALCWASQPLLLACAVLG